MSVILLIVLFAVQGLVGWVIGKKRKVGAVGGLILGLFFGWIGWIIAACTKKVPEPNSTVPENAPNQMSSHTPNPEPLKSFSSFGTGSCSEAWKESEPKCETSSYRKPNHEPSYERSREEEMPRDKSIFGSVAQGDSYLEELVREVCFSGEDLSKYERMVTKRYGSEVYADLQRFVEEMSRSAQRQRFTNTSVANLGYLARNVGLSESTVDEIVKHFNKGTC